MALLAKSKIKISFLNRICYSPCSEDSRTEKIISIGHSVAEKFYVEVALNISATECPNEIIFSVLESSTQELEHVKFTKKSKPIGPP